MTMPQPSMRQLLEAGVHFGHHSRRWNPKMKNYIFGVRNGIHIIDLQKSIPMFEQGLKFLRGTAAQGGRILFVGTKRQARDKIAEAATKCGQYYVNQRWLGGMLTNWKTISRSINRLAEVEDILAQEETGLTKKELLQLERERDKLTASIGGIRGLGGLPDALFIIDTTKEDIAILEAKKLGIPTVAVIDTNADPNEVDYPMPGNDDAMRAIDLYCDLASSAVLEGIQEELSQTGADAGASETPPSEPATKTKTAPKKKEEGTQDTKASDKSESADKSADKAEDKKAADKSSSTKKPSSEDKDKDKDKNKDEEPQKAASA